MGSSDSFEVHVSQDGRWSLAEVLYDHDTAIARAVLIAQEAGVHAARVVWSRFDAAADVFTERTIYKTKSATDPAHAATSVAAEPEETIGCRVGVDLYRPEARMAIHQVLAADLDKRKITVIELLHDWSHARALYDAGNLIQGAVQRHVVETARPGAASASHRIKRLYGVIDEAKVALHKLAHATDRPQLGPQGLGAIVEAWADQPDGERMIFSVLVEHLRSAEANADSWRDKLGRLAEVISPMPRAAELRFVDDLATEILNTRRGLAAFIGARPTGVEAVMALLAVVDGSEDEDTLTPEAARLREAAGGMAALPGLRNALARRARRICESGQPLGGESVPDEVRNIGALWRAINATAQDGPSRRLLPALERRVFRQMSAERLGMMLGRIPEPWRRVESLLELECNVIAAEAKAELAKYLHTVLADKAAPAGLDERTDNPAEVLRRLRRFEIQVRGTALGPQARDELCKLIDRHAVRLITERKLVDILAKRHPIPWEQALALMELVLTDHFTHGEALRLAQDRMIQCLKAQGGVQALNEAMRGSEALAAKGRAMYDFLAASRTVAAAAQ
jgi:hypothetical protein